MRTRGAALFFTGFTTGALAVVLLIAFWGTHRTPVPVVERAAAAGQAADRPEPGELAPPRMSPDGPAGIGMPVAGLKPTDIRDTFHENRDAGRPHEAIDIMAPRGTPVYAVDSGTVKRLFTSAAGGLTIYQFDPREVYCYYYAHLDRYAEGLAGGMAVKRGDLIGYAGSTGNADPSAPHLHFAIFELGPEKQWWEGKPVNPYPILIEALKKQ
jgi:murein DD-endopeptidase MepM/ murein hydrolase activator NlpD